MINSIKVSDKGQVSIPNEIRAKLGISKGDRLLMFEIKGKIILEKQDSFLKKLNDISYFNEKSLEKIWDNQEDEIWNTYLENAS